MNHIEIVGKVVSHLTKSCGLCVVIKFEITEGDLLEQTFQNIDCQEHNLS